MFAKAIRQTPLTSQVANDYFTNISGASFQDDVSFLATLRALAKPRMTAGDYIRLKIYNSHYGSDEVEQHGKRVAEVVVHQACDSDECCVLGILNLTNSHENNEAVMDVVADYITNSFGDGWVTLQKVTDFFRKSFRVMCFINPDLKSVLLVCDNLSLQKYHYLQCGIFAYLPWYFSATEGVTQDEMDLINALRERSHEKYSECVAKIAEQYDFREMMIRDKLKGFEVRAEKQSCIETQNRISNIIDNIEHLKGQLSEQLSRKNDEEIKLLGLQTKIANTDEEEESEIMDYFLRNKNLYLLDCNDDTIIFACRGYVEYFDEDEAGRMISNKSSYVYKPDGIDRSDIIPSDDMELLMRAIFLEHTFKMKFCATYRFALHGEVNGRSGAEYGPEFNDCMPNPHIDSFSCLGGNEVIIAEVLQRNDYVAAIEQAISSCKSLNFGDYTVMKRFMDELYGCSRTRVNTKCIELPDGRTVYPKEAIAWLKEQEEEEEMNE